MVWNELSCHAGIAVALRLSLRFRADGRDHGSDDLVFQEKTLVLVMAPPKSSFLDKVLGRIGRLDAEGLQTVVQRLARELKFSRDTLQH